MMSSPEHSTEKSDNQPAVHLCSRLYCQINKRGDYDKRLYSFNRKLRHGRWTGHPVRDLFSGLSDAVSVLPQSRQLEAGAGAEHEHGRTAGEV